MNLMTQAMAAQQLYQRLLLRKNNVVGVAVGFKNAHGEATGEPAVVVLVERKKPLDALSHDDRVPRELEGLRTDVVEVGVLRAQQALNPRQTFRPTIPAGASVGHFLGTAGTLGAVVRDRDNGELLMLSNNHVLANSNFGNVGDPVLQPGVVDGGVRGRDDVAALVRHCPLFYLEDALPVPATPTPPAPPSATPNPPPTPPATPPPFTPVPAPPRSGCDVTDAYVNVGNRLAAASGSSRRVAATTVQALSAAARAQSAQSASPAPDVSGLERAPVVMTAQAQALTSAAIDVVASYDNLVDVAVARPFSAQALDPTILQLGRPTGTKATALGMMVAKMGRTTGFTQGRVVLLNATVNVQYTTPAGARTARLVGQVITEGMSDRGDSGALVLDPVDRRAVGLLFAGSGQASIFTPIERVLDQMNVTLVL